MTVHRTRHEIHQIFFLKWLLVFFANLFYEPKMQSIDYKVYETRCIIFEEERI